jgi:hypothetical protein
MPNDPPPTPPRRSTWTYALVAAAIWATAAYDLLAHKPAHPAWTLAAAKACGSGLP